MYQKERIIKEELNKSLTDRFEEIITLRILEGSFKLNQRINVNSLKKEFGTSVTPIREALNRLAQRGLVTISSRVGYYVKNFTVKEIEDIYDLREILEIGALEDAINNIGKEDIEFIKLKNIRLRNKAIKAGKGIKFLRKESPHLLIIDKCGNKKLKEVYFQIYDYVEILLSLHPKGKETFDEHLRFIDALEAKDLENAKRILKEHIESSKEVAKKIIKNMVGNNERR